MSDRDNITLPREVVEAALARLAAVEGRLAALEQRLLSHPIRPQLDCGCPLGWVCNNNTACPRRMIVTCNTGGT